jgi:hypothetical protein
MTEPVNPRWTYRTNRAFGVLDQGDTVTFDDDDDPVMVGLVGAGYLDLVSGPPGPGIPSEEAVGTPTISQTAPARARKSTKAKAKEDEDE